MPKTKLYTAPALGQIQVKANLQQQEARQNLWANLSQPQPYREGQPIIATGHQPAIWHPGILAKYLATRVLAQKHNAQTFHLLVDQDTAPALGLKYVTQKDHALSLKEISLANENTASPICTRAPANTDQLLLNLRKIQREINRPDDLSPLIRAVASASEAPNLARQLGVILNALLLPYHAQLPFITATDLLTLDASQALLSKMLAEAPQAIRAYNAAVNRFNTAKIPCLFISNELVQLPLWAIKNKSRIKVYADITSTSHRLVDAFFHPIDSSYRLAPRALLLTGITRLYFADLFIHGAGGFIYDQITTDWLTTWLRQPLATIAKVSADLFLPLNAPTASAQSLHQAINAHHHLKHNIAQRLSPDHPDALRKKNLLEQMGSTSSPADRRILYKSLQELNQQLRATHEHLLIAEQEKIAHAKQGIANAKIANQRDFPLTFYPRDAILDLVQEIKSQFTLAP